MRRRRADVVVCSERVAIVTEQERVKGDMAAFWVAATLRVLLLVVVGYFGGSFVVGGITLGVCILVGGGFFCVYLAGILSALGGLIGAGAGLVGGIRVVRRMHRKRKARLAAEQEPDVNHDA